MICKNIMTFAESADALICIFLSAGYQDPTSQDQYANYEMKRLVDPECQMGKHGSNNRRNHRMPCAVGMCGNDAKKILTITISANWSHLRPDRHRLVDKPDRNPRSPCCAENRPFHTGGKRKTCGLLLRTYGQEISRWRSHPGLSACYFRQEGI